MNTDDLVLPGYRMIRTLGEGGFGQVFRAIHEATGAEVAVKVVLDDQNPEALGRFKDEARILHALGGQNVPKALDLGLPPESPVPYLAMELIDGVAMSDLLRAQATVPGRLEVLRHVLPGVCRGLQALHAQGAVHRDLKPENMMWRRSDRQGVLIDLGLVKAGYLPPKTATGFVLGTPAYMAPEQLTGKTKVYGGETDVYQLGLVLLLSLEGRFEDPDVHEIDAAVRRCTHGVERLEARLEALGISPELAGWIRGATEPIPDGRTVGLAALPVALASTALAAAGAAASPERPAAHTQPSRAAPTPIGAFGPAAVAPSSPNRTPIAAALGFLLGGLVAGFLGGGTTAPSPTPPPLAPSALPFEERLVSGLSLGDLDLDLRVTRSRSLVVPASLSCSSCEGIDQRRTQDGGAWLAEVPEVRLARAMTHPGLKGFEVPKVLREEIFKLNARLVQRGVPTALPPDPLEESARVSMKDLAARSRSAYFRDLPEPITLSDAERRVAALWIEIADRVERLPELDPSDLGQGLAGALRKDRLLAIERSYARLVLGAWLGIRSEAETRPEFFLEALDALLVFERSPSQSPQVEYPVRVLQATPIQDAGEAMLLGLVSKAGGRYQQGAEQFAVAFENRDSSRISSGFLLRSLNLLVECLVRSSRHDVALGEILRHRDILVSGELPPWVGTYVLLWGTRALDQVRSSYGHRADVLKVLSELMQRYGFPASEDQREVRELRDRLATALAESDL